MTVAKATRHNWLNPGGVFNLGSSVAYHGQKCAEAILDQLEVSR
jgi:hypothetical protein